MANAPGLVDWSELLVRLRARAGPLSRIARQVGMDVLAINKLARGEVYEPKFSHGIMLLDIAADHLTPDDWHAVRGYWI